MKRLLDTIPGFRPIKALAATAACCSVLALAACATGCSKEPGTNNRDGIAELTFVATATPGAGTPWGAASAQAEHVTATTTATTRAGAEPIPDGTLLRAMVFTQNDDPTTATPLAQGCYRITGNTGAAIPETPADRIALKNGTYDFYFISPEKTPAAGKVTAGNGSEVLTSGKQTLEVKPDASGRCNIAVQLKRRSAMLDAVIYYETGSGITSLAVDPQSGMTLTGLLSTAEVPLDETAFTPTGNNGTAYYEASRFATATEPAGTGTSGVSTFTGGTHRGIPVLPGTADIKVTVPVILDGTTAKNCTATVAAALFEEGKYYTLKLKISQKGQITATIAEWIPSPGNGDQEMGLSAMNLSAKGTANSYIVSQAGTKYRFDARIKGNGKGTLKINDPDVYIDQRPNINPDDDLISPKPLVPASAFVIWSTGSSLDAVVKDLKIKDGYVHFTTTGDEGGVFTAGNVLIGVKDAGGNLIWSWHIWATDYDPATEDVTYTTRALVGKDNPTAGGIIATPSRNFTMMGRNLGAMNNTPGDIGSFGLLYQWGRKDPFIGAASVYSDLDETTAFNDKTTATKTANGYAWTTVSATSLVSGADAAIAYAIQHPTSFHTSNSSILLDWMNVTTTAEQRDYLWGNPTPTNTIPNQLSGTKSIYDPCPPGYRVPRQDSWTRFTTTGTTTGNSSEWNVNSTTWTNGNGWTYYYSADKSGGTAFHPATGYRHYTAGVLCLIGTYSSYWSASPYYSSHHQAGLLTFTGTKIYPLNYGYRDYGMAVRCAKE